MLKILVTGGSGMLGRALVALLSKGHAVTAVSRSGALKTEPCDLSSEAQVARLFDKNKFDAVIHAAAYSDVDGCEKDPGKAYTANALATKNLAGQCGRPAIPFIYISTNYVFDGRKGAAYSEEDRVCPVNIYGLTKLEGEHYARALTPVSAIVRTSWLFGVGNPRSFVNAIVPRILTEKNLKVLDDQTDSPTYVNDLAEALRKMTQWLCASVQKNPSGSLHEVFHVCNAGSTTRLGMASYIREVLGAAEVDIRPAQSGDIQGRLAVRPAFSSLSTRHFEEIFNSRLRPWQESLHEYLNAHRAELCAS